MNTKHTPGPWFITEGPTYGNISRLKVESAADAERPYGMVIMERTVSVGLTGAVDQEYVANARLIAAAPDHQANAEDTVKYAIPRVENGKVVGYVVPIEIIERHKATIAKATGTTN